MEENKSTNKNVKSGNSLKKFLLVILALFIFAIVNIFSLRGEYLSIKEIGDNYLDLFFKNLKVEYTILLMDDKLSEHLKEIDETATARYNLLMKQFAERENITEELKANNQLEWVGKMNSIKNCTEEIIFNELIYVDSVK